MLKCEISREFNVLDTNEKLKITITFPEKRSDGFYESTYNVNFRNYNSVINVVGFSNFDVISSCFATIGLKIRAIIREKNIKFDFDGLEVDDLFPLSSRLKEAGGWSV